MIPSLWVYHALIFLSTFSGEVQLKQASDNLTNLLKMIRFLYMKQANIKTIENYLLSLPDSAVEQVVAFVGYLNYIQNLDCEYSLPDEQQAINQYRNNPADIIDWDTVKASI